LAKRARTADEYNEHLTTVNIGTVGICFVLWHCSTWLEGGMETGLALMQYKSST